MEDTIRAFISMEMPDRVKKELYRVASVLESPEIKVVPHEQLHITLFFFAQLGKEKVNDIIRIIEGTNVGSFEATINGFEVFNKRHPGVVFAKMDDRGTISGIYNEMLPQITGIGLEVEERDFTPHITVARTKHFDRNTIDRIDEFLSESTISCQFAPVSISLKQSVLGQDGPVHTNLHTRMLGKE